MQKDIVNNVKPGGWCIKTTLLWCLLFAFNQSHDLQHPFNSALFKSTWSNNSTLKFVYDVGSWGRQVSGPFLPTNVVLNGISLQKSLSVINCFGIPNLLVHEWKKELRDDKGLSVQQLLNWCKLKAKTEYFYLRGLCRWGFYLSAPRIRGFKLEDKRSTHKLIMFAPLKLF